MTVDHQTMATERTAVQLYRDLLRMVRHSAGVNVGLPPVWSFY